MRTQSEFTLNRRLEMRKTLAILAIITTFLLFPLYCIAQSPKDLLDKGRSEAQLGNWEEAALLFHRSLHPTKNYTPLSNDSYASAAINLSTVYLNLEDWDAIKNVLLPFYQEIPKKRLFDHPKYAWGLENLIFAITQTQPLEDTLFYYPTLLEIYKHFIENEQNAYLRVLDNYADTLAQIGNAEEALRLKLEYLSYQNQAPTTYEDKIDLSWTLSEIGDLHWDQSKYSLSLEYYERALQIGQNLPSCDNAYIYPLLNAVHASAFVEKKEAYYLYSNLVWQHDPSTCQWIGPNDYAYLLELDFFKSSTWLPSQQLEKSQIYHDYVQDNLDVIDSYHIYNSLKSLGSTLLFHDDLDKETLVQSINLLTKSKSTIEQLNLTNDTDYYNVSANLAFAAYWSEDYIRANALYEDLYVISNLVGVDDSRIANDLFIHSNILFYLNQFKKAEAKISDAIKLFNTLPSYLLVDQIHHFSAKADIFLAVDRWPEIESDLQYFQGKLDESTSTEYRVYLNGELIQYAEYMESSMPQKAMKYYQLWVDNLVRFNDNSSNIGQAIAEVADYEMRLSDTVRHSDSVRRLVDLYLDKYSVNDDTYVNMQIALAYSLFNDGYIEEAVNISQSVLSAIDINSSTGKTDFLRIVEIFQVGEVCGQTLGYMRDFEPAYLGSSSYFDFEMAFIDQSIVCDLDLEAAVARFGELEQWVTWARNNQGEHSVDLAWAEMALELVRDRLSDLSENDGYLCSENFWVSMNETDRVIDSAALEFLLSCILPILHHPDFASFGSILEDAAAKSTNILESDYKQSVGNQVIKVWLLLAIYYSEIGSISEGENALNRAEDLMQIFHIGRGQLFNKTVALHYLAKQSILVRRGFVEEALAVREEAVAFVQDREALRNFFLAYHDKVASMYLNLGDLEKAWNALNFGSSFDTILEWLMLAALSETGGDIPDLEQMSLGLYFKGVDTYHGNTMLENSVLKYLQRTQLKDGKSVLERKKLQDNFYLLQRLRRELIGVELSIGEAEQGENSDILQLAVDRLKSEIRQTESIIASTGVDLSVLEDQVVDFDSLAQAASNELGDHEALIVFGRVSAVDGFGDGYYLWAFDKYDVRWLRTETLSSLIWNVRDKIQYPNTDLALSTQQGLYELYQNTLGKFEDLIAEKSHLIFVLDGTLTAIPPHVMIVEEPREEAAPEFLIDRHAISVAPSLHSFVSLRTKGAVQQAPEPLLAFADPLYDPVEGGDKTNVSSAFFDKLFSRGGGLNQDKLRSLPRLTDTRGEVEAVRTALGGSSTNIYLDRDASETTLKKLSKVGELANHKVIYLATHGFTAKQSAEKLGAGAEPGLALAGPLEATELDDGFLTASEAALLNLNADWVVLAACNTAAASKVGSVVRGDAEALSGLAQSFFYAGARSLLVSHWAVNNEATVDLMTELFNQYGDGETVTGAEALQVAMLKVKAQRKWNHPYYWAPFILVGQPE